MATPPRLLSPEERAARDERRAAAEQYAEAEKQLALLKRQKAALDARDSLLGFTKLTMPDPEDPNDPDRSRYQPARHHEAIAAAIEEVERGGIQFLILTMPPRHGKSQLVSRQLPAWFLGRHPDQNVVVATYNDDFAKDFGADVRTLMRSPQYKLIFPDTQLIRGGEAKDRLQTMRGGMATFVGVGGSLTGRGAHCFPAGTLVETDRGQMPIENLEHCPSSVRVVSVCHHTRQMRLRHVEAFSRRKATRILRITTSAGRVVQATPDHPFYTRRGYVQAAELAAGDHLLCAVRDERGEESVRDRETRGARADEILLLERMLGPRGERSAVWAAQVRGMRGRCTSGGPSGNGSDAVLLPKMSGGGAGTEEDGAESRPALDDVRGMRNAVSVQRGVAEISGEARAVSGPVLQHGMREPGALSPNVGPRKPGVSTRAASFTEAETRGEIVSRHAGEYPNPRRGQMRALRGEQTAACAPRQRNADGQPVAQSDPLVRGLSFSTACGREINLSGEADTVLRIDEVPLGESEVEVFDIQVEDDHNFFANGVLVHNCLIVDDIIKSYEEARSQAFRDRAWDWFTKVAMTRRMGRKLVIITFTRWHPDDIIGRLTDPENEHYNRPLAEKIKVIDLPAIALEDDPLGRAEGELLWPEWYDREFMEQQRMLDPLGFEALYQQRPTVADGIMFRREHVQYYGPDETMPSPNVDELRIYCASDHAVSTAQRADRTALLKVGVDRQGNIFVLDCWWQKASTDVVVEAMLQMGGTEPRPLVWWAEKGHISKSIGPFLRRRMSETGKFFAVSEVTPSGDKEQRAQSIAARMSMGKVFWPKHRPWTQKAIEELMSFPNGLHDDFVDAFAYIGLGLAGMFPASAQRKRETLPKFGTLGWVKAAQRREAEQSRMQSAGGF